MSENKLKGTKTEQNLINAFAGESQARNRYTYFAKQAKKEGYEQISAIFLETAENEKEHAKLFYEFIGNTMGKVNGTYPFEMGSTEENLLSAAAGENEEWTKLYEDSAKIAQDEGFPEIANTFKHVIVAEKHHEQRYLNLYKNIKEKTVFEKEENTNWLCRKCGYVHQGKEAPIKCPNCKHPQGYFQVLCENY